MDGMVAGKYKARMRVDRYLECAGLITQEKAKVLRVDESGVWLDNGPNDPSGPFDAATGEYLGAVFGFRSYIRSRAAVSGKDKAASTLDKGVTCYGCDSLVSLKARADADGFCPVCGAEIELCEES